MRSFGLARSSRRSVQLSWFLSTCRLKWFLKIWDDNSQQGFPPDRCAFPPWPSQQSSSSDCPGSPWYFLCREFVQNTWSRLICDLNYFPKLHLVRSLEASVAFSLAAAPVFPLRPMWPRKPFTRNGMIGTKMKRKLKRRRWRKITKENKWEHLQSSTYSQLWRQVWKSKFPNEY